MGLDEKTMKKWTKALRSGKYRQARGTLVNTKTGGMCCLGVFAVEVLGYDPKELARTKKVGECIDAGPAEVYDDISSRIGDFSELAKLNDLDRARFSTIADHIEKNYKDLNKEFTNE